MELTSYAINENMTHVLRICSWIPVTFVISVVIVFCNYVFLEHKTIIRDLVCKTQ